MLKIVQIFNSTNIKVVNQSSGPCDFKTKWSWVAHHLSLICGLHICLLEKLRRKQAFLYKYFLIFLYTNPFKRLKLKLSNFGKDEEMRCILVEKKDESSVSFVKMCFNRRYSCSQNRFLVGPETFRKFHEFLVLIFELRHSLTLLCTFLHSMKNN